MNYFDLYSSYPDRTIAAAWDSQIKKANNAPWLADTLTECGGELFTRFAACYAELRALPRSARRALQRQLARSSELAAILPEYLQQGGRRLQHRMAWSLAGAAFLLALGQGVSTAATIAVTTNNPNIASDGQCSLIEAIVNANNDAATHPDCPTGSGADTIVLPANADVTLSNVYVTLYSGTRSVGLPLITSRITIEGNGATIARRGNAPDFALMSVRSAGDLTIHNATLSGGSSTNGSGVSNVGTLSIQNSTISGNTGSSVANGGTLTIENSTISNNTSNFGGSGIVSGGTLTIKNSTISDNTSNFSGGGVFNGGTLIIENSTISNNRVKQAGGGIFNHAGRLTITNSTISGNIANQGGGVSNFGYCYYNIYNRQQYCYFATLNLTHSLIAGNQAAVAPEVENVSSFVNANNFNLFGSNGNAEVSGFALGPTDIVPSDSLAQILGPLQNNGGRRPDSGGKIEKAYSLGIPKKNLAPGKSQTEEEHAYGETYIICECKGRFFWTRSVDRSVARKDSRGYLGIG
jgi:hypothetical protein